MPTRIRGACEAFEVTVDEPRRGDRELRIDVVFAPDGPTDRATIELRLYARSVGWVIRKEEAWDTEASVPRTKAILERGETGRLRFTRPLPPFVTSYRSENLELTPVLVTEGDDASRLRLQIDVPAVAEDAWLVVRGLPRSEALRPTGLVGRLRRRRFNARVEELRRGRVVITVQGPQPLTGGRARLEALEYTRDGGKFMYREPPVVTTESALVAAGAGRVRADLPLPEATAAPASIECTMAANGRGIRWLARFDLEDERGDITRAELPLHVGVERGDVIRQLPQGIV